MKRIVMVAMCVLAHRAHAARNAADRK